MKQLKVLVLTNMFPIPEWPCMGIFVGEQVESLRREGVDVDVLFVNGPKNRLNYLWGVFRLWGRLLTRRYDLIHAHYVFSGIIARMQFLLPVVLTHHGPEVFMSWERVPCRLITPLMDRVIVVSQEQIDRARFDRAVVIPCGIDFDLFKPAPQREARLQLGLPLDRKLVLWAGDPRPEKRFDLVQEAAALAQHEDPGVELVVLSGKSHEVVPLYMNACDVLLLVSEGEGSPMVVKEAMACNLPVVSVAVGDVAQVIGGTQGCYLCDREPADIAEKLGMALNPPRRTEGREIIQHFELSHISRQIIRVYEEMQGRTRRLPSPKALLGHRKPQERDSLGVGNARK